MRLATFFDTVGFWLVELLGELVGAISHLNLRIIERNAS